MIMKLTSKRLRGMHPGYDIRAKGDGFLLTPLNGQIFPRDALIIDSSLYVDDKGIPLNGITPIDLTAGSQAEMTAHIVADLEDREIDINSKPRGLLFLRSELIDDEEYLRVTQPGSATCFYLITSWDRNRPGIGSGVSRKYATGHGALRFYRHRPKSPNNGRDLWLLPISFLSESVVSYFDQAWQTAVHQAIDAHARRYPKDNSVNSHRQRIARSSKRHGA